MLAETAPPEQPDSVDSEGPKGAISLARKKLLSKSTRKYCTLEAAPIGRPLFFFVPSGAAR